MTITSVKNGMEMYTLKAATAFRSIIGLAIWFEKYRKNNKAEIFNSGVLINFGTSKTVIFFGFSKSIAMAVNSRIKQQDTGIQSGVCIHLTKTATNDDF